MKKVVIAVFTIMAFAVVPFGTGMAADNEYPNGIEGIKAASVPPPGYYYKMYNVYYAADTVTDNDGNDIDNDFDLTLFVNSHRFLWVSDWKILGADYAADIIVPIFNVDLEIGAAGLDSSETGLGDICIEPFVLGWHGPKFDAAFALAFFAPTGKYDKKEPASPGKDMWTYMTTLGGTVYFDAEKTFSASVLARYEIHGEKDETNLTPGDDFHFEWGIGKNIAKIWDVGLTGYCQWQVTDDSGDNAGDFKDHVFAVGPEVSVFIPPLMGAVSLRSQWEFESENTSEGDFTTLTFVKIF